MSKYNTTILAESNLLAYYQANEAAAGTTLADSKGGYNGACHGGYTLGAPAHAGLGTALALGGTSGYVDLPMISVPGPITVEAWVNFPSVGQTQVIVGKAPVNAQWLLFMDTGQGGGGVVWRSSTGTDQIVAPPPSVNTWHHVVATQTGTAAKLYIDGALAASGTIAAIANGTDAVANHVYIGQYGGGGYYTGSIDEVAIYGAELSASAVLAHYNAAVVDGPVPFLNYNFNHAPADVDLLSYVKGSEEIGSGFALIPAFASNIYSLLGNAGMKVASAGGRVYPTTLNKNNYESAYLEATPPPTINYLIQAQFIPTAASDGVVVVFRLDGAAGTGYLLRFNQSLYRPYPMGWSFAKFVAPGTEIAYAPSLGTPPSTMPNVGIPVDVAVSVVGSTFTVNLSGGLTGTWAYTDSTYATGKIGLGFIGNNATPPGAAFGTQWKSLSATDLGVGVLGVTGPGSAPVASGGTYQQGATIQGAAAAVSFTVTNTGGRAAAIGAIAVGGCTLTASPANTTIPPGGSAAITVSLPTGALGVQTSTISIASDTPTAPYLFTIRSTVVACNPNAPGGAITGYTITGPTSGDNQHASGPFTLALISASAGAPACSAPITINLSDGGAGGTFDSPVIVVGSNPATAAFHYTAPLSQAYSIASTNSAGLTPPAAHPYQGLPQLGHTSNELPSLTPDFGGFQLANAGAFAEFYRDITGDALDPRSDFWMSSNAGHGPIFGGGNGDPNNPLTASSIPFAVVDSSQVKVPITFGQHQGAGYGATQSDNVPGATTGSSSGLYPFPPDVPIEGMINSARGVDQNNDQHISVYIRDTRQLFEAWSCTTPDNGQTFLVGVGAIFDLANGTLRPAEWTSADVAGLPILPLLLRMDEMQHALAAADLAQRVIPHAIRITMLNTGDGWVWPARHSGANNAKGAIPCGARLRLKQSVYDALKGTVTGQARILLETIRRFGFIVADNGTSWYYQAAPDSRWDVNGLFNLQVALQPDQFPGGICEVVNMPRGYTITGPAAGVIGSSGTYTIRLLPTNDTSGPAGGSNFHVFDDHGWYTDIPTFMGNSATFSYPYTVTGTVNISAYDTNTHRYPSHFVTGAPSASPIVYSSAPNEATTYTLVAPSPATGAPGVASAAFVASLPAGMSVSLPVTVTPHSTEAGGSFGLTTFQLSNTNRSQVFHRTAAGAGPQTITTTNDRSLTDPAGVGYTVSSPVITYQRGSLNPVVGFSIGLPDGVTLTGTATITAISSAGDTFLPASIVLSNTVRSGTFTFLPTGSTTISFTNNAGLTNPPSFPYTPTTPGLGRTRNGIQTGGNL